LRSARALTQEMPLAVGPGMALFQLAQWRRATLTDGRS
jgi:hypothetical protein